jgi:hypothetical protein
MNIYISDVMISDVIIAINSRNILGIFLGWQSLIRKLFCHAYQFKLENVSRTGSVQWKNLTVFLAISRISRGVHARLS